MPTRPTTGTTTFNNYANTTELAGGSGASANPGLTASNVDGWDITLHATNSVSDTSIFAESQVFTSTTTDITVDGTTVGGDLTYMSVQPYRWTSGLARLRTGMLHHEAGAVAVHLASIAMATAWRPSRPKLGSPDAVRAGEGRPARSAPSPRGR